MNYPFVCFVLSMLFLIAILSSKFKVSSLSVVMWFIATCLLYVAGIYAEADSKRVVELENTCVSIGIAVYSIDKKFVFIHDLKAEKDASK